MAATRVCVPPPNSYGLCLLLQLKMLTDYDLASYGHNTPEYVALQVGAKEEAWRSGSLLARRPGSVSAGGGRRIPPAISSGNTKRSARRSQSRHGNDTTYVATADKFGNWASLIQSVHHSFGCGIVVEGTGIVLNNRMSGFNLIPGHANELAPAKLPAHTLSPALVLKDNVPVLAIGTAGRPRPNPVSRPDPLQSF